MENIRLSKLMAERGLCSRREADSYIEQGWVRVDGEAISTLGHKVSPQCRIELDPRARQAQAERITILLNKPIGYVSGQPEKGYAAAVSLITRANQATIGPHQTPLQRRQTRGLAPAGRLDIDSQGLLVLTQDGRIARQLIDKNSNIEKEYLVRVSGEVGPQVLQRLRHGLTLDGKTLKTAKISRLNQDQLKIILTEGRKRQLRRMCELVGLQVQGLKRVRIGNIALGRLPEGKWRFLRDNEHF